MIVDSIFEKIGFEVNNTNSSTGATTIYYLNNPDGSIRWFWSADLKEPLFLKFYNILGLKSKLFALAFKLIFKFKLQKFAFKKLALNISPNEKALFNLNDKWAIFTGTVGPNRKAVLFISDLNNSKFVKIPLGENASQLINNESSVLNWLTTENIQSFKFPQIIPTELPVLQLSDISQDGGRLASFSEMHLKALKEIAIKSEDSLPLNEINIWNETKRNLDYIKNLNDNRIPKAMLRKLTLLVNSINEKLDVQTSFCHADFTSWNMYVSGDKLNIYDWELAQKDFPLGFDAFHFISQQGILISRKPWKHIEAEINEKINNSFFLNTHNNRSDTRFYLKLYIIINTVYYLKIYSEQKHWHMQIAWLLSTWNDALSSMLKNKVSHRKLMLMDLFDYLQNQVYATLKFPEILPENHDLYSDVDLCMNQNLSQELTKYLENHSLTKLCKVRSKTFMSTVGLVCKDNSILSLDLIWKFKRNSKIMMGMEDLLIDSSLNQFGVKEPEKQDVARYVALFYGLNGAKVPEKYQAMGLNLLDETSAIDKALFAHFQGDKTAPKQIQAEVNKLKENRGISGLKNRIAYYKDLMNRLRKYRGIVITFSGVDGAGKSTVIENVKFRIEKQLRRKVVVIRHRPSILPILSAWTKGKAQAEKEAASKLPRQGTNKSSISSLVRFAYYYSDYLFGQFFIYLKYTLTGHIILYDRYYFDFINDSRRSNIQLPDSITRFGYRFVMKPDFNFFLYADANLILKRKQELDADSIRELTSKYLTLFESLNSKKPKAKYIPIENIDLEETLKKIVDEIAGKGI